MKKDEIVVLSNEIEIIDGIEIDWSKYKGRNTNQSKKTYIELCELLHKNGHILESNYINVTSKVYINFNCGHKPHMITPNNYKRGKGCPICSGNSPEHTKEELYNLAKRNGHTILGEYKGASKKILIDFNCGHKPHKVRLDAYKKSKGCPECTKEKLIEAMKEKSKKAEIDLYEIAKKNNHKILGEYIDSKTLIEIDFNCGHKPHMITPNNYKSGRGCPICSGTSSKYAEKELYELVKKNGHKILTPYISNREKILIDFNCGHKHHWIAPVDYKRGKGCPICKASKGEKEVARILKEMNIKYEEEYRFEDCKNVLPLPFDFYISELNLCIEFDGQFHYEAVRYRKKNETEYDIAKSQKIAEERLKETQRRDKIKTDYCKNNGINLIRIPYWEFDNIEKILKKELSKYIQAVA